MIRLDRTVRKLQIALGGAVATNQLNVIVSGVERIPSAAAQQAPVIGFTQIATTAGATDVDICAAPQVVGRVREIESIYFRNRDTAAVTVSIKYDDNATDYVLYSATLAVGDFVAYSYNSGWQLFDASGNAKVTTGLTIGATITGGTATRVLFVGTGPVLDDDAEFTYNDTTNVLTVNGSTFGTNTQIGGTLGVTGAVTLTTALPLTGGGTNASLTASNGGIFYSTSSAGAILSGTATAGQIVRSGANAAPTWSTATYPATAGTAANVLRSDGTNFVSAALAASDLSNGTAGTGAVVLQTSGSFITPTLGVATGTAFKFTGLGYGVFSDEANAFIMDDNAGQARMFAEGPNAATLGSYIFYGTRSDGTNATAFLTLSNAGNATVNGTCTISGNQLLGSAAGTLRLTDGSRIGADSTDNLLDDASTGAGTATLYIGNASINVTSDIRLKRDIEPTQRDALMIIKQWDIVDFYFNDPSDKSLFNQNSCGKTTGVIAQQVVNSAPWLVNAPNRFCPQCVAGEPCNKHTSVWHFNHAAAVPLLAKAIQQLDQRLVAANL